MAGFPAIFVFQAPGCSEFRLRRKLP